jgi:hypothetical protein
MRVKIQNEIMIGCYKYVNCKNRSGIIRIDPHAIFVVPDEDENCLFRNQSPL